MHCICCQEKVDTIDYKNAELLRKFVSAQFKILSPTRSGLCQKHQRRVANAVKLARFMALMPYTKAQTRRK